MIDAFWSDPHFGHAKVIEYDERPFITVEEMNEALIENYNAVVGPNDTCLWGGDCFFYREEDMHRARMIMNRLNGRKLLVLGNHDRNPAVMFDLGFTMVAHETFLKMGHRNVRVKHYPYFREPKKDEVIRDRHGREMGDRQLKRARSNAPPRVPGEVLIHGHTHSKKRRNENMIHIGVTAWDYRPATFDEVAEEVAKV